MESSFSRRTRWGALRVSAGQDGVPAGAETIRREPLIFEQRPRTLAQREAAKDLPRDPPLAPDIAFLAAHGIPEHVLQLASRLAALRGTAPLQELLATGFDRAAYWSLLARHLGLPFAADLSAAALVAHAGSTTTEAVRLASSVLVDVDGASILVVAPGRDELAALQARLRENPAMGRRVWIAAPETIRAFLVARRHTALTHYALNRLPHVLPRLSARRLGIERMRGPATLAAACLAMALVAPIASLTFLGIVSTLFFFNCCVWKAVAAFRRHRPLRVEPVPSAELPSYTVLVPLYREERVVADLVRNLARMDYPASKLQILLLLEADDRACRAAVAREVTSPVFEVLVVAPGGPRTKPKALTYALPLARGEFVVVFDAEDRPEPDQLRKAAAAFRERPDLGCVQARLAPDHEGSWLAKMFKLEYAANFEVLLPALADCRVPIPLGGTSNHFPRRVLERVGAWDPFNVTEDADLGIRLARFGYRTATILSRTYEEAPLRFRQWLPQRRRWIKGWMQTSLLCFAGPVPKTLRLPLRDRLAVHGIISAGVVGLLIYPLSVGYFLYAMSLLVGGGWPSDVWAWLFVALNANLLVILAAASVSALRGLLAIRALHLAVLIPLLPIYWAFMSVAAWHALLQFVRDPSRWEKTPHGIAKDRRPPTGP